MNITTTRIGYLFSLDECITFVCRVTKKEKKKKKRDRKENRKIISMNN